MKHKLTMRCARLSHHDSQNIQAILRMLNLRHDAKLRMHRYDRKLQAWRIVEECKDELAQKPIDRKARGLRFEDQLTGI